MPRTARIVLPNHPLHVVQRGHNGRTVFHEDGVRRRYLSDLREWKEKLGCRIYAFCLMPNHTHLVVSPSESREALGELMKRVAARMTRRVNKRRGRKGTLWEGRYKSSLIDTDRYLLACCRYVEMNPVRAGMAARPEDYPWSSFRHRAGLERLEWLDEDPIYRSFGRSRGEREAKYRRWMESLVSPKEMELIRTALKRGQLTGDRNFVEKIRLETGIAVESRGRGRPMKKTSVPFSENKSVPIYHEA